MADSGAARSPQRNRSRNRSRERSPAPATAPRQVSAGAALEPWPTRALDAAPISVVRRQPTDPPHCAWSTLTGELTAVPPGLIANDVHTGAWTPIEMYHYNSDDTREMEARSRRLAVPAKEEVFDAYGNPRRLEGRITAISSSYPRSSVNHSGGSGIIRWDCRHSLVSGSRALQYFEPDTAEVPFQWYECKGARNNTLVPCVEQEVEFQLSLNDCFHRGRAGLSAVLISALDGGEVEFMPPPRQQRARPAARSEPDAREP